MVTWSASLSVLVLVFFQSGPREEAGLPRKPPAELELMSKGGPLMGTVSQTLVCLALRSQATLSPCPTLTKPCLCMSSPGKRSTAPWTRAPHPRAVCRPPTTTRSWACTTPKTTSLSEKQVSGPVCWCEDGVGPAPAPPTSPSPPGTNRKPLLILNGCFFIRASF